MQSMLHEELQALVLNCHPYSDTPSVVSALNDGAQSISLGGEVELCAQADRRLRLSWEQFTSSDFGLGACEAPVEFSRDQVVMTNYEPWRLLIGARLSAVTVYGFAQFEGAFGNAIEHDFVDGDGHRSIWVWTGSGPDAQPVDDLTVSFDRGPSNLSDLRTAEHLS